MTPFSTSPNSFVPPSVRRIITLAYAVVAVSVHGRGRSTMVSLPVALLTGSLAACALPPQAQQVPPANATLPESLRATPQEILQDVLTAVGDTTYSCRRDGERLSWVGTGSEATLVDAARQSVGTVAPGRYFTAYDGSYLIGRVTGEEIVTTGTLPWQRLAARFNAGAERQDEGRFAKTTSVQRVQTTGGLPPVPVCDQEGVSLFVPYTATYLFYRAAGPAAADTAATPVANPTVAVWNRDAPGAAAGEGQ